MQRLSITPVRTFQWEGTVPGDKSISHRAIMLGSMATGKTKVHHFLPGDDCLSTIHCFRQLGVRIERTSETEVLIEGKGFSGLQEAKEPLYVGNSGTTIRLMMGILAGTKGIAILTGDDSIGRRPMGRVVDPLRLMGAKIWGREDGKYTPLAIKGTSLRAIDYQTPVPSAQVKSAILLAGLHAEGETTVTESASSRDHTERMLKAFGGTVRKKGNTISVLGGQTLKCTEIQVPGDISSAAFLLAAAAMVPGSKVTIQNVGLNPTRTGVLDVLQAMGADVTIEEETTWGEEPVGTISIEVEQLKGTKIAGSLIPRLIDELPILAVVATQALGETIISDAAELKVKETNRISMMVQELRKLGANIEETDDGMIISGPVKLSGGICQSHGDHRIGMAMAIAGLGAEEEVIVEGSEAIRISFPGFERFLQYLKKYEK